MGLLTETNSNVLTARQVTLQVTADFMAYFIVCWEPSDPPSYLLLETALRGRQGRFYHSPFTDEDNEGYRVQVSYPRPQTN